ncbi:Scr1 family TA system antitoxin-like transcriptional regulator [Kitasatospora sp. NBC_00315]|uniref:helix-turn-helix domain-containing protein n=1 Tax=Kitasatospora sp. NBC_00315 TaxID=2975963 RepID=UPI00324C33F5
MAYAETLDPSSSVLAFYATDLRRRREAAGLTQRALAGQAHMAPSLLNKIEAGRRLPTKDLSEVADAVFETVDHFQRLWPLVIKYAYPTWFRPYVDLEEAASVIRSYEVQVVPGLLQTEDYARAILAARRLDRETVEEQVAARLQRQHILDGKNAPELWIVLDENVLRRRPSGTAMMRAQLESLVAAADRPRTVIQVIPLSAGVHAGVGGPFATLTLDEGPSVVYVDGFLQGQILADPAQLKAAGRAYDLLTAVALPPDASVDLIAATAKELT